MIGEMRGEAADALEVPVTEFERIVDHLRQTLPNEGVGLIAVERCERGGLVVAEARRFYPGANIHASPTRYEMDPRDLVAALREIDHEGWFLGAIVHSHPAGPAIPSVTDLAEFLYPEALLVIASFAAAPVDVRAWKLVREGRSWHPHDVPIHVRNGQEQAPPIADSGTLRE